MSVDMAVGGGSVYHDQGSLEQVYRHGLQL